LSSENDVLVLIDKFAQFERSKKFANE